MEEMVNQVANSDVVDEVVSENTNGPISTYVVVGGIAIAGYILGKGIEWTAKKVVPWAKKTAKKVFKKKNKMIELHTVADDEEIDLTKDEFSEFNDDAE